MSVSELRMARPAAGPQLRLARLWWALGWAIVLFITVSCLEPPRYVPNLHLWDKLEHALAFGGMTFWFGGLVRRRRYPVIAVLMLLFGGGIEIAQGAMRLGRDEDVMDFVADAVGISVASGLLYAGLGAWTGWVERILSHIFWRTRDS
jgi:VanZ family protein